MESVLHHAPNHSLAGKIPPGTHFIRHLSGPRTGFEATDSFGFSPQPSHYSDGATPSDDA
jgi:hypothetical protein